MTSDPLIAIEKALPRSLRDIFLSNWFALNPQHRGAQVADVLEQLVDSDSNLEVTEPLLAKWSNASEVARSLLRPAILALYYIYGEPPTQTEALALAVDAMDYHDHQVPRVMVPRPMAPMAGIDLITKARVEQVTVHGHTPEHDRTAHADGSIAKAAAAYAMAANGSWQGVELYPWPVHPDRAHPIQYGDDRRIEYLAAAGALCAAEIDRLLAEKEGR